VERIRSRLRIAQALAPTAPLIPLFDRIEASLEIAIPEPQHAGNRNHERDGAEDRGRLSSGARSGEIWVRFGRTAAAKPGSVLVALLFSW